jgi:hypothetical protein
LHWGVWALASVGSELKPSEDSNAQVCSSVRRSPHLPQVALSLVVILLGMYSFASVLGNINVIMTQRDASSVRFREQVKKTARSFQQLPRFWSSVAFSSTTRFPRPRSDGPWSTWPGRPRLLAASSLPLKVLADQQGHGQRKPAGLFSRVLRYAVPQANLPHELRARLYRLMYRKSLLVECDA